MMIPTLTFDERGLIPAIIQDVSTQEVLMLGYMNEDALEKTLATGQVTFYSRSRQTLWTKGETSGNVLTLSSLAYDCDQDALLVKASPAGPTCHTGEVSCFYRQIVEESPSVDLSQTLFSLERVIAGRQLERPKDSYTTYLFEKGLDKILKKVGEESAEVIIAAKNRDPEEVVAEGADLLYHLLVLLAEQKIPLKKVLEKLEERKK